MLCVCQTNKGITYLLTYLFPIPGLEISQSRIPELRKQSRDYKLYMQGMEGLIFTTVVVCVSPSAAIFNQLSDLSHLVTH